MLYANRFLLILACLAAASATAAAPARKGPKRMDVAAIYFPGFHHDAHYDQWFGKGWNEWDLLKNAPARFPGQQINQPAWGYFDEADPKQAARQIDLAADHGINAFIFDWYWYSGTRILYRPLEDGFLHAKNRNRLKFALMWANHEWKDYFPAPYKGDPRHLLKIEHSPEDFSRVIDYGIAHYFRQPNYWRVDGGLYFGIFEVQGFLDALGGPEKAKAVLDAAREQVKKAGLGKIHFAAFIWQPEMIARVKAAGFDSTTTYTISADGHLPEKPLEEYSSLAKRHEDYWKALDTGVLPYAPVVTVGWDSSPRWEKDTPWPPERNEYPYGPLAIHSTPEKFGALCSKAAAYAAAHHSPYITVNAWNEWTEGSALLPTKHHGTAYLDALLKAFGK